MYTQLIRLNLVLDSLIEFKLHQPKPDDEPPSRLPVFKQGQLLDYTTQVHVANRAGRHRDIRVGDRLHGLLSWATRKELPEEGKKIAIHPQPVHPHSYLGWSGKIKSGYGAGDVRTEHVGKALVTRSTPDELHATLASKRGSHRLAFIRSRHGWLLAHGKVAQPPSEAQKPKAKSVQPEQAKELLSKISSGTSVQPKIDGALAYITIGKRPDIFSHRKSSVTGKNVVHTERFWGHRPSLNIPRKFHGHTLIAELYGTMDRGAKNPNLGNGPPVHRYQRAIEPQRLGGILNSNIAESIHRQRRDRVKLKAMPFDIAGEKAPYPERLKKLREIVRHLPRDRFHVPEEATTPKAAQAFFDKIKSGRHPLTKEGVIVNPPTGRPIKIKNVEEENVKIHSLFPGKGRFHGHPGGFVYSDKHGRALGRVGTGFTDQTRQDLAQYVGRTARVRHQGRFRSGRLRAPSFIGIDESR